MREERREGGGGRNEEHGMKKTKTNKQRTKRKNAANGWLVFVRKVHSNRPETHARFTDFFYQCFRIIISYSTFHFVENY